MDKERNILIKMKKETNINGKEKNRMAKKNSAVVKEFKAQKEEALELLEEIKKGILDRDRMPIDINRGHVSNIGYAVRNLKDIIDFMTRWNLNDD